MSCIIPSSSRRQKFVRAVRTRNDGKSSEYRCLRYAIVCIGETNSRLTDSSSALRKILTSVKIESGSIDRIEQRKFISTRETLYWHV